MVASLIPDRSRAELDPRWDQTKIGRSRLLILGNSLAAQFAAIAAAGMGFGHIVMVGADGEADRRASSWPDVESLRKFAKLRYPDVPFTSFSGPISPRLLEDMIGSADACICVLDRPEFHGELLRCSRVVERPATVYLRVRARGVAVNVGTLPKTLAADLPGTPGSSLLGAGLALSEVRRLASPCADDTEPEGTVAFHLSSLPLRVHELRQAGAGGTGSWFAAASSGICETLRIWDGDRVDATNLPRCPWLSTPGINKAMVLTQNLSVLSPQQTAAVPVDRHAGQDWLDDAPESCVAAFCTDTLRSRRILNTAACSHGIPAVNLGTSLFGAAVYTVTRHGPCMECRFPNLDKRIADEAISRQPSCGRRPEAAAAISNMIAAGAGSMIAARLRDDGFAFPGVLSFDAFDPKRLWIDSVREPCKCFSRRSEENAAD